jgi:hypothetical protein
MMLIKACFCNTQVWIIIVYRYCMSCMRTYRSRLCLHYLLQPSQLFQTIALWCTKFWTCASQLFQTVALWCIKFRTRPLHFSRPLPHGVQNWGHALYTFSDRCLMVYKIQDTRLKHSKRTLQGAKRPLWSVCFAGMFGTWPGATLLAVWKGWAFATVN